MMTLKRGMVGTSGTSNEFVLGSATGSLLSRKPSTRVAMKLLEQINTATGSNRYKVGPYTTSAKSSRVVTTTSKRIMTREMWVVLSSGRLTWLFGPRVPSTKSAKRDLDEVECVIESLEPLPSEEEDDDDVDEVFEGEDDEPDVGADEDDSDDDDDDEVTVFAICEPPFICFGLMFCALSPSRLASTPFRLALTFSWLFVELSLASIFLRASSLSWKVSGSGFSHSVGFLYS